MYLKAVHKLSKLCVLDCLPPYLSALMQMQNINM